MLSRKRTRQKTKINPLANSNADSFVIDKGGSLDVAVADTSDVKLLESLVLGSEGEFLNNLQDVKADNCGFSSGDEEPEEKAIEQSDAVLNCKQKPAWVDEDDDNEITVKSRKVAKSTLLDGGETVKGNVYAQRVKQFYERSVGTSTPKWAVRKEKRSKKKNSDEDDSADDDDDDDLTRRTGSYIGSSVNLPKSALRFKRICDLTKYNKFKTRINTTEFLKQSQVMLVSGYSQRVMIFQIDGKENPLLQTVHFDRYPIETAHFSADGERIIVGSMLHRHFYYYDMLSDKTVRISKIKGLDGHTMGKFIVSPNNSVLAFAGPSGTVDLVSATTYDYISTLSMNGNIRAMCFSSQGNFLYTYGDDGEVYIWDVRGRSCVHKFFDEGSVKGTAIAVSPKDTYVACGSNSGVVNLYDSGSILNNDRPKPLKCVKNLTTWVSDLRFNENNEILSYFSNDKMNAVKMLHLSSFSTFNNFPADREEMGKINSVDFSVNGGYFSCGNDKGQALLYRLFHYKSY